MIGVVICTHAGLAGALLDTAKMIVGEFPAAVAVSVQPGDGPEQIRSALQAGIKSVDDGSGVMLLVDMFGGTPSNIALSLLADDREVITGVNLPMLLKLYTSREGPLPEVASRVARHSRDNTLVAGELLRGRGK